MSDFKDIEKEAFENGILLDKCGLADRYYDFGSYQDLCGMTPEEILENMRKAGQGGTDIKTLIKLSATVVSNGSNWVIRVVSDAALLDNITITVLVNGEPNMIPMNAGSIEAISSWYVDKYSVVSATVSPLATEKAIYKISITNPNGDGVKTSYIVTYKNGEETSAEAISTKVDDNVSVTVPDIAGCDFVNWEINGVSGSSTTIEFVMPDEDNLIINLYYAVEQYTVNLSGDHVTLIGSGTYNYGTQIEISAIPEEGYVFTGWSDGISASTRHILVTNNISLTAITEMAMGKLAYWGEVNTLDFDALGKTFTLSALTNILTSSDGGTTGCLVNFAPAETSTTYEYLMTETDNDAFTDFIDTYNYGVYKNYIDTHSKYFVFIVPSEYLINGTIRMTDLYGGVNDYVLETGYVIDGTEYSLAKLSIKKPTLDDPDTNYPIDDTYMGSYPDIENIPVGEMFQKQVIITILKNS